MFSNTNACVHTVLVCGPEHADERLMTAHCSAIAHRVAPNMQCCMKDPLFYFHVVFSVFLFLSPDFQMSDFCLFCHSVFFSCLNQSLQSPLLIVCLFSCSVPLLIPSLISHVIFLLVSPSLTASVSLPLSIFLMLY